MRFFAARVSSLNPQIFLFYSSTNIFNISEHFASHFLTPNGMEKMKQRKELIYRYEV